jgi:CBS domain-containing protein
MTDSPQSRHTQRKLPNNEEAMNIEQLMTRPVQSCQPQDTINRAAQIMWDADIGCVPVVDADNRVVGMITDRDIAMAAYTQGRGLDGISVESAMAKQVYTCSPSDEVSSAEQCMQKFQVRRLPVVDSSAKLVGIVSMNDIALQAAQEKSARKPEVTLNDVALTLAQIGQHRHESMAAAAQ